MPRIDVVTHPDSMEKILKQISRLSPDPVTYRSAGQTHVYDAHVTSVLVMPSMFTRFHCAAGCTACCQKFTLDYPASEFHRVKHQEGFGERVIEVNGKQKKVWTNNQNENLLCDFLRAEKPAGGLGCDQWPFAPLSCASAPQIQIKQPKEGVTILTKQHFDDREDWTPVPQCEFHDVGGSPILADVEADVLLLSRFAEWARYFGIKTYIPQVQSFLVYCLKTEMTPTRPYPVIGQR